MDIKVSVRQLEQCLRSAPADLERIEGRHLSVPVEYAVQSLHAFVAHGASLGMDDASQVAAVEPLLQLAHSQTGSEAERVVALKYACLALGTSGARGWTIATRIRQIFHARVQSLVDEQVRSRHVSPGASSPSGSARQGDWQAHWQCSYWNAIAGPCGLPERADSSGYRTIPPAEEVARLVELVRREGSPQGLLSTYLDHVVTQLRQAWEELCSEQTLGSAWTTEVMTRLSQVLAHWAPGLSVDKQLLESSHEGCRLHPHWHAWVIQHALAELKALKWIPVKWQLPVLSWNKIRGHKRCVHGLGAWIWVRQGEQCLPLEWHDLETFRGRVSPEVWAQWQDRVVAQYLRDRPAGWETLEPALRTVEVRAWRDRLPYAAQPIAAAAQAWVSALERTLWGPGTKALSSSEEGMNAQALEHWAHWYQQCEQRNGCVADLLVQMQPVAGGLLAHAVAAGQTEWVRRLAQWLSQVALQPAPTNRAQRRALGIAAGFIDTHDGSVLHALVEWADTNPVLGEVIDALVRLSRQGWLDEAELYSILAAVDRHHGHTVFHCLACRDDLAPMQQRLLLLASDQLDANDSMRLLTQRDRRGRTALAVALCSLAPERSDSVGVLLTAAARALEQGQGSRLQILDFCLALDPTTGQSYVAAALLADRRGAIMTWVAELPASIAPAALERLLQRDLEAGGEGLQWQALRKERAAALLGFRTQAMRRLGQVRADPASLLALARDVQHNRSLFQASLITGRSTAMVVAPVIAAVTQRLCPPQVLEQTLEWHQPAREHWVYQAIADIHIQPLYEWLGCAARLLDTAADDREHAQLLQLLLQPGQQSPLPALVAQGLAGPAQRYLHLVLQAARIRVLDVRAMLRLLAIPPSAVVDAGSADLVATIAAALVQGGWGSKVVKEADRMQKQAERVRRGTSSQATVAAQTA